MAGIFVESRGTICIARSPLAVQSAVEFRNATVNVKVGDAYEIVLHHYATYTAVLIPVVMLSQPTTVILNNHQKR